MTSLLQKLHKTGQYADDTISYEYQFDFLYFLRFCTSYTNY